MSDINITNIDDCALKYTATPKASCSHRYQIEKKLSHKAGRQTLLALDLVTHQQVVIKILQFDSLFEWDDLKLFEREAKTLKNLNNPAIPKYLGYFEIDNEQIQGFALVQTYIDAPSLEDTIRQGRKFTEAELIELAQKLLKILDYLHSSNPPVIHRDIKPSNILLSNRTRNSIGELYLVDFGSVQTAASKSEGTITIVGSYGYIPLEQFGGQTTTASDLYSLGMTLIYLITGVHPAELPQTDGRVKFEDSQLSDGLKRWLAKMTEPYLDKRFDSAESALTGLLIKEQSSGIFLKLRPHNTKIKLYRDRHKLDIVFDRGSFKPSLLRRSASDPSVFLSLTFLFGLLCLLRLAILIFPLSFILLLWELWKKQTKYSIRFKRHYQVISINKNKSVKKANYNGEKPKKLKWIDIYGIDELNLIVYSPGYISIHNPGYVYNGYINSKGTKVDFCAAQTPHQLSLHADEQEYVIGDGQQTKAELFWLGKEISNFLGLELVIFPTPTIPSKAIAVCRN